MAENGSTNDRNLGQHPPSPQKAPSLGTHPIEISAKMLAYAKKYAPEHLPAAEATQERFVKVVGLDTTMVAQYLIQYESEIDVWCDEVNRRFGDEPGRIIGFIDSSQLGGHPDDGS